MTTLIVAAVFPWLLIVACAWLGYQLVRQNGRILLRLEAIERKLAPQSQAQRRESAGLPVGSTAPDFELPDLAGVRRKLSISRRDAEATRTKAVALALSYPIVMQKQWEISLKYGMFATPIGYLIDERGTVVKDVAVGVEPILALADNSPTAAAAMTPPLHRKEALLAT